MSQRQRPTSPRPFSFYWYKVATVTIWLCWRRNFSPPASQLLSARKAMYMWYVKRRERLTQSVLILFIVLIHLSAAALPLSPFCQGAEAEGILAVFTKSSWRSLGGGGGGGDVVSHPAGFVANAQKILKLKLFRGFEHLFPWLSNHIVVMQKFVLLSSFIHVVIRAPLPAWIMKKLCL